MGTDDDILDDVMQVCRQMAAKIAALGGRVTARELGRRSWRFRQVPGSVLQTMVSRGFGRWEDQPAGPRGGRPTKVFVLSDQIGESPASPNALRAASPNAV
jgi:hypothetical protein